MKKRRGPRRKVDAVSRNILKNVWRLRLSCGHIVHRRVRGRYVDSFIVEDGVMIPMQERLEDHSPRWVYCEECDV
jgi:hypothetical protein